MTYRIREVDASEEENADIIREQNGTVDATFPYLTDDELERGYWWLAYDEEKPVAFAGLIQSRGSRDTGYLKRAGVLPCARGHSLQLRLMRARIAKARKLGWTYLVSESTGTPYSANNFIRAGFKIYYPAEPWAFKTSIYWIKKIG